MTVLISRRIVPAFLLALMASFVAPLPAVSGPSKVTLQQLLIQKTIRMRDLRRLDFAVTPGHGSLLTGVVDGTTEVQFWVQPGVAAALGVAKIVLISTNAINDENNGTIVWPPSKVGRDFGRELQALYPR